MQDYCHIHRCLMSKNDEKKMREKRKNSKENPIFIPRFSLSFFISIDGKNKRYLFNLRIFFTTSFISFASGNNNKNKYSNVNTHTIRVVYKKYRDKYTSSYIQMCVILQRLIHRKKGKKTFHNSTTKRKKQDHYLIDLIFIFFIIIIIIVVFIG